jgi:hypothetical protein
MTFNFDPLGKVLTEVRGDATVAAIAGANPTSSPARVRGGEPAPGDAQAKESYRAFVVLVLEGRQRFKRVPIQRPRIIARCYGRTMQEAAALASAVSNAIHERGRRIHANGLGIYNSWDDGGGEQDTDPDTDQPMVPVFIDLLATTQAVAV